MNVHALNDGAGTDAATIGKFPQVYFIRHGETAWSLTGQHTGLTDIALTRHGEDQARDVGRRLRAVVFSTVLMSPLLRARRTCALAGLDTRALIEPDLVEWNYGDYEGRISADIAKTRPGWNAYEDDCPGGDTPEQISLRADRLVTRLRKLDGNVALFSHGQFGCALTARWIGLPVSCGQHLQLDPAAFNLLKWDQSHPRIPVIAKLNNAP